MLYTMKGTLAVLLAMCAITAFAGCKTTSYTSERTYENNSEPQEPAPPAADERTISESEWQMTSPGEMVVEP